MQDSLKVINQQKCIACGLCVIESSLIKSSSTDTDKSSIGLTKSFIKISGKKNDRKIDIDYGQVEKPELIVKACPKKCFELDRKDIT